MDTCPCSRSRDENEKDEADASLSSLELSSSYLPSSSDVSGGLNFWPGTIMPMRKSRTAFSSRGMPSKELTTLPSRIPNTVGRALTSRHPDTDRCWSVLTFTSLIIPPALTHICSRAGVSCLHGPHQSAYTSSNTGTGESMTSLCRSSAVPSNTTSSIFAGGGLDGDGNGGDDDEEAETEAAAAVPAFSGSKPSG